MANKRKKTYIIGCVILSILAMLSIYFVLILSGVIETRSNRITVTVNSVSKEYDGTAIYATSAYISHGSILPDHTIKYVVNGEQTVVGQSMATATVIITDSNNIDVTSNYDIEIVAGTVTVMPIRLRVYSGSATKVYDGTPLSCDECGLESGNLLPGHHISIEPYVSIIDVGVIENALKVKVLDSKGNDVTHLYSISKELGYLYVTDGSDGGKGNIDLTSSSIGGNSNGGDQFDFGLGEFLNSGSSTATPSVGTGEGNYGGFGSSEEWQDWLGNWDNDEANLGKSNSSSGNNPSSSGENPGMFDYVGINPNPSMGGGKEPSKIDMLEINSTISALVYFKLASYYLYDSSTGGWDANSYYTSIETLGDMASIYKNLSDPKLGTVKIKEIKTTISKYLPYYANTTDINEKYTTYSIDFASCDFSAYLSALSVSSYLGVNGMDEYLQVPSSIKGQLQQIILENELNTRVISITNYLTSMNKYDLKYDAYPAGVNPTIYFLTNAKAEGVCSHYATAATLLYRTLGIPARYCAGYLGNAVANKNVTISSDSAHAWVEIYLKGRGWVQLEVTGGLSADGIGSNAAAPGGGSGGNNSGNNNSGENNNQSGDESNKEVSINLSPNPPKKGEGSNLGGSGTSSSGKSLSVISNVTENVYLKYADYYTYQTSGWDTSYYTMASDSIGDMQQAYSNLGIKSTHTIQINTSHLVPYYTNERYEIIENGQSSFVYYYLPVDYSSALRELQVSDYIYSYGMGMDKYLQVPYALKSTLQSIIQVNSLNSYIGAVQEYLTSLDKYNTNYSTYPLDVNAIVYFLTDKNAEGVSSHYATAATLLYRMLGIPARCCIGYVANLKAYTAGTPVEHSWVEIYINGIGWVQVEVTETYYNYKDNPFNKEEKPGESIPVTINTSSLNITYGDSESIISSITSLIGSMLRDEHEVVLSKNYSSLGAGYHAVTDVINVVDVDGEDVTDWYNFSTDKSNNKIFIAPKVITITTASSQKTYDGKALENHTWSVEGELSAGHRIVITFTGQITNPGKCDNTYSSIKVYNAEGNMDVTDCYTIIVKLGTLTVLPPNTTN